MLRRFACMFLLPLALLLPGCATSTHLSRSDAPKIANRTYVIVGASSGFGRGTAVRLGSLHANVVIAARRTELLEGIAREIKAAGGNALVVTTDASKPDEVQRLADAAVARFGRIDVWMNVAGIGAIGRFWEIPLEDYSRLIDINVKGVLYGSQIAIRQLPWAADTPWWPHAANYSGHAPRMAMMDDPQKIVDAMVWVSLHPREELPVGWKARASFSAHHIFPDLVERVSANIQRAELEKASPAAPTSGSLHQPMASGTAVDGGVRDRMKQEDEARAKAEPR